LMEIARPITALRIIARRTTEFARSTTEAITEPAASLNLHGVMRSRAAASTNLRGALRSRAAASTNLRGALRSRVAASASLRGALRSRAVASRARRHRAVALAEAEDSM